MSTDQLIAIISALCAVLSLGGIIVARLIKGHTTEVINELIREYLSELKPNHGSSLRDDVLCIKSDITDIKVDLANLEGKFDQHVKENNG
jgi:hypothetical protein